MFLVYSTVTNYAVNVLFGLTILFCCCYLVSSGTVTINADSSLQILAEEAVSLEQLDINVSLYISLYKG